MKSGVILSVATLLIFGELGFIQTKTSATHCPDLHFEPYTHTFEFAEGGEGRWHLQRNKRYHLVTGGSYQGSTTNITARFILPDDSTLHAQCVRGNTPFEMTYKGSPLENWVKKSSELDSMFDMVQIGYTDEFRTLARVDIWVQYFNSEVPHVSCNIEIKDSACFEDQTSSGTTDVPPPAPQTDCRCGTPNARERIIGGQLAASGEYPWMAHLLTAKVKEGSGDVLYYTCGGSILTPHYILTAAHCVNDTYSHGHTQRKERLKWVKTLVGQHDVSGQWGGGGYKMVAEVYVNEHYDQVGQYTHDIALLRLAEPLKFGTFVSPVCMPDPTIDYAGLPSLAIGWGEISPGVGTEQLMELNRTVETNSQCRHHWGSYFNQDYNVCNQHNYQKGTCQGDSGGPLQVEVDGKYQQIGVVSFGSSGVEYCAKARPGVFIRVTAFLDWISSKMELNHDKLPCSM